MENRSEDTENFEKLLSRDVSVGYPTHERTEMDWSLQLWLGGFASKPKLLYGWVTPFVNPTSEWIVREPKGFVSLTVIIGGNWQQVSKFLLSLFRGSSIGQASTDAGFCIPPESIIKLNPLLALENYSFGTHIQLTKAMLSHFKYRNVSASPSEDFPVIVSSFYLLDKAELLSDSTGTASSESITKLVHELTESTGFNFGRNDLERFGNIEIFQLQGAAAHEDCLIGIVTSREKIEVRIEENSFPASMKIMVRCQQIAQGHILFDEMKKVTLVDSKKRIVKFDAPESGLHEAMLEIWVFHLGKWRIAWSHSVCVVRKMCLSMHVKGATIGLRSCWLDKYEKSSSLKERAETIGKIEKYSIENNTMGTEDEDPAIISFLSSEELRKLLPPPRSEALWLDRMLGDVDEPKLKLVEWFRNECSTCKEVIILDPYFDTFGMELVARIEYSEIKITIITTKNDRKDTPNSLRNLKKHFRRLEAIMHQNMTLHLAKKNAFHDRYILMKHYSGNSIKGFHLSNSLQKATQNFPLLITPIPTDVLLKVEEFVSNLKTSAISVLDSGEDSLPAVAEQADSLSKPSGTIELAIEAFFQAKAGELMTAWEHLANHLAHSHRSDALYHKVYEAILSVEPQNLVEDMMAFPLELEAGKGQNEGKLQDAVRWIQMSFRDSLINDDVYRLGFEIVGKPWWILYAAEYLANGFPKEFLRWFDLEGTNASDGGLVKYARRQILYTLRHQMFFTKSGIARVTEDLSSSSRNFAKLLLESGIPAIRASAARSFLEPFTEIDESMLNSLKVLADVEQRSILEWVIRSLLQEVNKEKKSEKIKNILDLVIDRLFTLFENPQNDVKETIQTLNTRLSCAWHEHINNVLLDKYIDKGVQENIRVIWLLLFVNQLESLYEQSDIHFYDPADSSLSNIAAYYTAKLPNEDTTYLLDRLEKMQKNCLRALNKPFPKGHYYAEWLHDASLLIWLDAFFKLTKWNGIVDPLIKERILCCIKAGQYISQPHDSQESDYASPLDEYVCAVTRYIRENEPLKEDLPIEGLS